MVSQLLIITWLFYEDEEERFSNMNLYSSIIDNILSILNFYSSHLEQEYNEDILANLAKIICLIKCEIHKDKEVVFLDVLLRLFEKHITLYYKYKPLITEYQNVLNFYIQFLFEIIEALFFYFLQPAK